MDVTNSFLSSGYNDGSGGSTVGLLNKVINGSCGDDGNNADQLLDK